MKTVSRKLLLEKAVCACFMQPHRIPADKDSGLDFFKFMTFLIFEAK